MQGTVQQSGAISGMQALIVSTATRVGMGNLVGVVAAISAGGAGAVFWMWVTALIGTSTAFVEATLAQIHKQKDPLYGGFRGGPAYYIHNFFDKGKNKRHQPLAVLFALSGLLCWCGVSQVISNSVSSSFANAFHIPPIVSTVILVVIAAFIVLRKNATVKVLDVVVPVMAAFYFGITVFVIINNVSLLPNVFSRIINEAFGVIIDTLVLCSCTAMIVLLAPSELLEGLVGTDLLQTAMNYHFGKAGVIFTAITLWLFSFSTFIGILFYARSNVAYLFGDNWKSQTIFKVIALVMLFIGGLAVYTFVWDIGDIGVGLMTIFNMIVLIPMSKEAINSLNEYTNTRGNH